MNRPNKQQFIQIIKNGDDSKNKRVILHLDGKFELSYSDDVVDRDHCSYVGRGETLDSGNDYVGLEAAEDVKYIDDSYAMYLDAWIKFKKENSRGQYLCMYPHKNVESLEKIIDMFP